MNFWRRLRLFMFGVLLGCAMVVLFFKDRLSILTAWLPENRVLQRLQDHDILLSDLAACQLSCWNLDSSFVNLIASEGDVNFRASDTRSTPMIYAVEGKLNEEIARLYFAVYDDFSKLQKLETVGESKVCICP